ncbi:MAG: TIGR03905 family TSCPD domain-containing protein [Oscillospiraceae bacterium]|nr:TIGR03905 family TSCPD domain-containing protein [Oscillospiraceae bacterium]MBQ2862526.1 TIGR03905 family TSCPD domain-containing protein [Oscillospiraceae bacterium]MBQ3236431.1 TIGR03905 family TSCPD domain-containing protein [Oscillospiraceae bacterium]
MHYDYATKGTCSKKISFDMEADGTVRNIVFFGGCPGNLQAIPKILEGWKADDIIGRLLGNDCAGRGTSCADQLAKALIWAKEQA